jgi:hypothetical protein
VVQRLSEVMEYEEYFSWADGGKKTAKWYQDRNKPFVNAKELKAERVGKIKELNPAGYKMWVKKGMKNTFSAAKSNFSAAGIRCLNFVCDGASSVKDQISQKFESGCEGKGDGKEGSRKRGEKYVDEKMDGYCEKPGYESDEPQSESQFNPAVELEDKIKLVLVGTPADQIPAFLENNQQNNQQNSLGNQIDSSVNGLNNNDPDNIDNVNNVNNADGPNNDPNRTNPDRFWKFYVDCIKYSFNNTFAEKGIDAAIREEHIRIRKLEREMGEIKKRAEEEYQVFLDYEAALSGGNGNGNGNMNNANNSRYSRALSATLKQLDAYTWELCSPVYHAEEYLEKRMKQHKDNEVNDRFSMLPETFRVPGTWPIGEKCLI